MSITNKVISKRFWIAVLLVALFTILCMGDVVKLANDSNTPINIFYVPHLFSNIHFVFFYGLSICYLFADIYSVDNSELLEVVRKGKRKLFIQKLGVAIIQSAALYCVVVLTVIVMASGNITWDNEWGKLIHTLCYFNVSDKYQIIAVAQWNLETNYEPVEALLYSGLFSVLVSSFISELICLLGIICNRTIVTVVSIVMCLSTYLLSLFEQRLFYFIISPLNWIRLSLYGQEFAEGTYYPDIIIMVVTIVILMVCLSLSIIKIVNNKDLVLVGG